MSNSDRFTRKSFISAIFIMAWITAAAAVFAAEADAPPKKDSSQSPIHITADRMITQTETRTAEFIGNVHAVQGEVRIDANRLQVYYKGGENGENKDTADSEAAQDAIDRIIAQGNVIINFQDKKATSDKAVYQSDKGVLVLTGEPARIESESNYITGDEITLNRTTGEIIVSGKADKQVEAFFKSSEDESGTQDSKQSGAESGQ